MQLKQITDVLRQLVDNAPIKTSQDNEKKGVTVKVMSYFGDGDGKPRQMGQAAEVKVIDQV